MDLATTTVDEYIAWDSPLPTAMVVVIIAISSLLIAWALYRERSVLGSGNTWLFAMLRLIAMAMVVFMLLSPTSVVEESSTTKKAIAVMTDVSGSMTTIDPAGTADDVRWAAAQFESLQDDPIVLQIKAADRATVAMGITQRALVRAVNVAGQVGAKEIFSEHVLLADRGSKRTQHHLAKLGELSDSESQTYLIRLNQLLDSPDFDSLSQLARDLERDRAPSESGWREGLSDLVARVAMASRVLGELSRTLAQSGANALEADATSWRRFQSQSRSERVASLITTINPDEDSLPGERTDAADWRWSTFDVSGQPVANVQTLVRAVDQLADRDALTQRTDLAGPLEWVQQLRTQQPVAASFLFTDVAHNDNQERPPTEVAAQIKDSPVYVIPIGNASRLRDVGLVSVSAPSVAMRNDNVVIEATLEVYQCVGETCVVQLLQNGDVVDFRNVLIDSDSTIRTVRFDQRVSEIGMASFQVLVQPIDGELLSDNNARDIEINVTRSDIKVLLADDLPRWEYRYLAQLFRRDPKVDLDELLYRPRKIATGRRAASQSFPVDADQWNQYDIVILGDLSTDHLSAVAQETLVDYVRSQGGTVILIAGNQAMPAAYAQYPLAEVLPVKPVSQSDAPLGYAFEVTDAGRLHVALMIAETHQATRESWDFVSRFSPLHRVSRWRSPLPNATSLIAATPRSTSGAVEPTDRDPSTFLCWHQVGRGRVIYLSGPDTYRLRFLRGDRLHYRFWGQLMRWAIASDLGAGNQLVRIRTNRTVYPAGQAVGIEVELGGSMSVPPASNPLRDLPGGNDLSVLISTGDEERIVALISDDERPNVYRAEIGQLAVGSYTATPIGTAIDRLRSQMEEPGSAPEEASASFKVQDQVSPERLDTRCNRVLASKIAELTGGQVLPPTAITEVLALTNLDPIVTHTAQRTPLWSRWKYLWLVFGCLQTEWIFRKWKGLS